MFTDKLGFSEELLNEFLPCKIGDKVYTISKHINYKTQHVHYYYELDKPITCQGFIIENSDGNIRIRPAEDTWDGWYALHDEGFGYYTDKEKARKKVKELNELEKLKEQNEWMYDL